MSFKNYFNSILKEEASKEDKISALKSLAKKGIQYIVIEIVGSYYEEPQTVVDSFGRKSTSRNRSAKRLKIKDFYTSHLLHEYIETVRINYRLSKELYSNSKTAVKEWLANIESKTGDKILGIFNPSKDITIAAVEFKNSFQSSSLFVAFPRENTSVLNTVIESIGDRPDRVADNIDNYDELFDNDEEFDGSWVNSRNHLAKYFLNLPGNQEPIEMTQG